MRIKKWLMKQQWRVVQIRGIWSLFYGVLILAYAYFGYIPFFSDMGPWGPFAFAGLLLFTFLILGYIYDRVLVMWAPSMEVSQERNPFMFVPSPRDRIFWLPLYSALLDVTEKLAERFEADTTAIDEAREYYAQLTVLRPERKEDIDRAIELRSDYVSKHDFSKIIDADGQ